MPGTPARGFGALEDSTVFVVQKALLLPGIYLGSDSTGFEIRNPFSAAAFSPCLPKPNPANFSSFVSLVLLELVAPVYRFETNDGGLAIVDGEKGGTLTPAMCVGRTPFACSRHDVRERLDFALSRKMRPARQLTQPTENRKNAETRVNVSTWCERTAAPMLY